MKANHNMPVGLTKQTAVQNYNKSATFPSLRSLLEKEFFLSVSLQCGTIHTISANAVSSEEAVGIILKNFPQYFNEIIEQINITSNLKTKLQV